ncbi:MAG: substrate-binding domain-containing protein [Thermodesulfobacteriota bacterium]
MIHRLLQYLVVTTLVLVLAGCTGEDSSDKAKKELLVYCGITMVHPMKKIASLVEAAQDCKVTIVQGGSEDLYQSLKMSGVGDLYMPGSQYYREKHLSEGLLGDYVEVGYNQAALVVAKGNPKQVSAEIDSLTDSSLNVVIGNPETCSIGKQAEKILTKAGIFQQVVDNAVTLAADSRNMNKQLLDGRADLIFNWRATAFFEGNRAKMDALSLDPSVAPKNKLLINLLSFSARPELARAFMDVAASERGQRIFRDFGFLD